MLTEVRRLLEVQTLDQEILQLQEQLARYPQIWEEVKNRLAKKKAALEKAQKDADRHAKDRRRTEQKLRLFTDDLRKYQQQQNNVKTPREYEAISKQIEATRKKISQSEETGLALIEKTEEIERALENAKEEFEKIKDHYLKEKERIRVQFNEKKQRLTELEKEREAMTADIEEEVMIQYGRVNVRYPGNGVVTVQGGSCSGCHWQVLPDVLIKLHNQSGLVYCQNCSRILSEDEDYDPDAIAE